MENKDLVKECLRSALDLLPFSEHIEHGSKISLVYRCILIALEILDYNN